MTFRAALPRAAPPSGPLDACERSFCTGPPRPGCPPPFQPARCAERARGVQAARSAPPLAGGSVSDAGQWDAKYKEQYGQLAYASTAQQGNREDMQDFLDVVPKGRGGFLYAGVFDGHGGEAAGDYLSKHLYKVYAASFAEDEDVQQCSGKELSEHLATTFSKTDKELLAWLKETQEGEEALAGSTATVLLARKDRLVVANVGDSRAVLCRNGRPQDLSAEHRVYGRSRAVSDEIARVEAAGGWIADGRVCDILAVSRAFGDPQFKGEGLRDLLQIGIEGEFWDQKFADTVSFSGDPVVATPDVTEIAVDPKDEFVILASDGLWDVMSSKEAVDFARKDLRKGRSLQSIVDKLFNIALRRYSMDNVAIVIVDLGGGARGTEKKKSGWGFLGV